MANAVAPLDQPQSLAYEKLLHRNLWGVFLRVKIIAFTKNHPNWIENLEAFKATQ